MRLYVFVDPPHNWVAATGGVIMRQGDARALTELSSIKDIDGVTLVVPGEWVTVHQVDVPARNRTQMLAAVPYALEESLAEDVDELHFAPIDWTPGQEARVAVVSKALMDLWVKQAERARIKIDQIVPDYGLLPLHPSADTTVASDGEGSVYMRSKQGQGFVIEQDLFESWVASDNSTVSIAVNDEALVRDILKLNDRIDARFWDIGKGFTDWVENSPEPYGNLLSGGYDGHSKSRGSGGYRWAAIFIGAALLLKVLVDAGMYIFMQQESSVLSEQMITDIRETFPHVNNIVESRERFIMAQEMATIGTGAGQANFQLLLNAVSRATRGSGATISDISYRDDQLTVSCRVADFAAIDQLQARFDRLDYVDVELGSSNASDGQVTGRFVVSSGGA